MAIASARSKRKDFGKRATSHIPFKSHLGVEVIGLATKSDAASKTLAVTRHGHLHRGLDTAFQNVEPTPVPKPGTWVDDMNVVGTGRLVTVRAHPRLEPRVVSWLAELEAAKLKNMGDITMRFGSARPIGDRQVEFALAEELVIDTLVSFTGETIMIRAARLLEVAVAS